MKTILVVLIATVVIASAACQISCQPTESAITHSNLGYTYLQKGDFQNAILEYTEAIQLEPNHDADYVMRGRAYGELRQFDEAISDFNKAIELNPKYALSYIYRGSTYIAKGDLDRAIIDCSKSIELDPKFAPAYYYRAQAYQKKKEYDKTIYDATKAIELDPKNDQAYLTRAMCYLELRKIELLVADLNKIIDISKDPTLIDRAKSTLAVLLPKASTEGRPSDIPAITSIDQKPLSLVSLPASGYVALDRWDMDSREQELKNIPSTQPINKYGMYSSEIFNLQKDSTLDIVAYADKPYLVFGGTTTSTGLGLAFMKVLWPGKRSGAFVPSYIFQEKTDNAYRVIASYKIIENGDYQISLFNFNPENGVRCLLNVALSGK